MDLVTHYEVHDISDMPGLNPGLLFQPSGALSILPLIYIHTVQYVYILKYLSKLYVFLLLQMVLTGVQEENNLTARV